MRHLKVLNGQPKQSQGMRLCPEIGISVTLIKVSEKLGQPSKWTMVPRSVNNPSGNQPSSPITQGSSSSPTHRRILVISTGQFAYPSHMKIESELKSEKDFSQESQQAVGLCLVR